MDQSEQTYWTDTNSNVDQSEQADSIDTALDVNQPEQTKSTEIAIVSHNSDITLVVGPNKMQIRVQSACLKEASKPFAAMLSETWKDPDTKTIDLPDDDADAMLQICKALHYRYNELSKDLSPATALEVAIVADKYLLVETLSCVASRYWLTTRAPSPVRHTAYWFINRGPNQTYHTVDRHGILGMLHYATAAWMFNDADAFRCYTQELISNPRPDRSIEKGTRLDLFMSPALPVALEAQLMRLNLEIYQTPFKVLHTVTSECRTDCQWSAEFRLACLRRIEWEDFNDMPNIGISGLLGCYNNLTDPDTDLVNECSGKACNNVHDWNTWRVQCQEAVIKLVERECGLCLFCCKLGNWTHEACQCCHLRSVPRGQRDYFLQSPQTSQPSS